MQIYLKAAKTEVVIFSRRRKQLDCDPNLKLYGRDFNLLI